VSGPPVWSKKSPEILYATPEGMFVVSYSTHGEAFEPGKPRLWAARNDIGDLVFYDLAPDGKRFAITLLQAAAENKTDTHFTFLLNFFDELRRRAPAGGK
jgi:eukaryotic-like serine/threonine-protein kinase